MSERAGRQPLVRIDLTPLVDVVFLLLIFFMVSTTFREDQGLELRLPAASGTPTAESAELRVSVAADGSLRFEGRALDIAELERQARVALEASSERLVVVEADRSVEHGRVVAVMDVLRRAGARGLTVATAPGVEPQRD